MRIFNNAVSQKWKNMTAYGTLSLDMTNITKNNNNKKMNLFDDIKPTLEIVQINYGEQAVKSAFSRCFFYSVNITAECWGCCLTRLKKNLNSITLGARLFEIQLCWQSCVRLQLQCTSILSHVGAHQQPASLRCYTFFVCSLLLFPAACLTPAAL